MSKETNNNTSHQANSESSKKESIKRRDILKGLATMPVFGAFFSVLLRKKRLDDLKKNEILTELGLEGKAPAVIPKTTMREPGELIRLGIIGHGGRGEALVKGAGFVNPDWIERKRKAAQRNRLDKGLETFLGQEDLNVVLTGVCDVFDV
ncbi:MAG: gfo/Idh/MocA family oxidoreductase, partial [Candidatus Aminicenantaceae bacterium]